MSQSTTLASRAELFIEVTEFYARQMPLLEELEFDEFAATFTDDCVFGYDNAWQIDGREALQGGLRTNMARYGTSRVRHWFENRRIEPLEDGVIRVTATCLVSVTTEDGDVTFEPTCRVTDELIHTEQGLRTRSRKLRHDLPDVGRYFAKLAARYS
ncbi:MAG: hypothetical protein JWQ39_2059 [Glaciihabitans sp.]|nr:hypothetical protein [Glaciihabitans sp.]